MNKEIKTMEKLIEILKNLHPNIDFLSQDNLINDMILDSFDIVTLIAEIGEVFDVMISAKDIIPDNFNSAKKLFALIQKLEEEN